MEKQKDFFRLLDCNRQIGITLNESLFIPYVATMIPVIAGIAVEMGIDSTALYFGLLSGATLGGNCTPIGASANIAGIGILRKEGHEVSNADFFKIGIPFTLSAIVPAYILIWVLFGV